jgi:hypothetical protein
MHHGVDTAVAVIDGGHRFGDLPEIGEVDQHEGAELLDRRRPVEVDDVPTVFEELGDDGATELAAATRDHDSGHGSLPLIYSA